MCARVAPACIRGMPGSEYLISSFLSAVVTVTPDFSGRVRDPLAPLMVTASADTVAVTPCGRSTGAFATLLMGFAPLLRAAPVLLCGIAEAANPLRIAAPSAPTESGHDA